MRFFLSLIAFFLLSSPSLSGEYNFVKEQRKNGEEYVPEWNKITYSKPSRYKTYNGLPCFFNGAEVYTNPNAATLGSLIKKCCPNCKGYSGKKGQSISVKRGTPVYAIANMKLVDIQNRSSIQRCSGNNFGGCLKPMDDLFMKFEDKYYNQIIYYHLMSENPFVPGYGKGNCKIPIEYGTEKQKRKHYNCGGIRINRKVKKGDVIGFVGSTGKHKLDEHFSLGIIVNPIDPRFDKHGMVVPTNNFEWENYPTEDPLKYLLPIAPN